MPVGVLHLAAGYVFGEAAACRREVDAQTVVARIVPIAPVPTRSRPEQAAPARPQPVVAETPAPEAADVEIVSLEDADAEAQGKKTGAEAAEVAGEEEEVEMDESMDDAAFIEEEEEGDADVSDIIGEGIDKEEEQ